MKALSLLLPLLLGCQSAQLASLRRESMGEAPRDERARFQSHLPEVRRALVLVKSWLGTGSGAIIDPSGLVLTCEHASWLTGSDQQVVFSDGSVADAEVLGQDDDGDVALLRITSRTGPFPCLRLAEDVSIGEWVYPVTLAPDMRFPRDSAGPVLMKDMAGACGPDDDFHAGTLWVKTPVEQGQSGSPVLNSDGEVVGVVSAGAVTSELSLLLAASATRLRQVLPTLREGESYDPVEGLDARRDALFDGLAANAEPLWHGDGEPPSDWDQRFRAIVAEVRLEMAREWSGSADLTTQMTNDALERVVARARERSK